MNLRKKPNTDKLLHRTINPKGTHKFIGSKKNKGTPTMNQDNLDSETHKNSNINTNNVTQNTKTNALNS